MQLTTRILFPILLCFSGMSQASSYSYTYLNNPNVGNGISSGTFAYDINNSGQIAGFYTTSSNELHGFVYSNNVYIPVDAPNAKFGTTVYSINDLGQMAGVYVDNVNTRVHSFLYDGSNFITLDHPDAADVGFIAGTQAYGINNNEHVVGVYTDSPGLIHGFLYSGGSYVTLDVPNATVTWAEGINDGGIVVGYFHDDYGFHGFSYNGENYTVIDNPSAISGSYAGTIISGINNMGIMTGYIVGIGENRDQNFIYDGSAFTKIDVSDSDFAQIFGINDIGQIVGRYENANISGGFLGTSYVSPVPEPSNWLMMLLGLSLMIFLTRSRRINSYNGIAKLIFVGWSRH